MPIQAFNKLPDKERDRILAACLSEFAGQGYARASTNAIVKRLGIAKGSLFYWFGSKDDLYLHLIDRVVERFTEAFKNAAACWPDEILARFKILIEASIIFLERHPDNYRLFVSFFNGDAAHLLDRYMKEHIQEGFAIWLNWFTGVDTRGFREPPEAVHKLLQWVMAGIKLEVFALAQQSGAVSSFHSLFMKRLNTIILLLAQAIYTNPAEKGYR